MNSTVDEHCIELRPNCSLTRRTALLFFGLVCATSFGIAGLMTWQGFWPVLPFAGLEFPRHWAKVTLRAPHTALHPSRLPIESRGRTVEIGGFLTEEQRRGLAAQLKHAC